MRVSEFALFFGGGRVKSSFKECLSNVYFEEFGFLGAGQHSGSVKNLNDAAGVARSIFMIFIFYNQF